MVVRICLTAGYSIQLKTLLYQGMTLVIVNKSIYFEIVVNALHECFVQLGVPHDIMNSGTYSDYPSSTVFIIFTTHESGCVLPLNYISYNFEQLTTTKAWPNVFFTRLHNAKYVWDYSMENIRILNTHKIKAMFLPFGYSPCMEYNEPTHRCRTIDFAFTGCVDQKLRYPKLLAFQNGHENERLFFSNNCWGEQLVELYQTSKVGLNFHIYEGNTILEAHRIIPLIANKVWVISETSNDKWYDKLFTSLVTFIEPNGPCDTALITGKNIVNKPDEVFDSVVNSRYHDLVTNCRYDEFIKKSGILDIPGIME